jgi:MULE transposase domain
MFFYPPSAIQLAQRWVASHAIVVDATFSTNSLRLPLIVAVGVTNEDKTFPIAFSYCPSEAAESFIFFFESLRAEFFNSYVPEPAVVLSDLTAGMISAFDTHKAMPHSKLQFCSWHVGDAMKLKFRRAGHYTNIEIDGGQDKLTGVKSEGLSHYIWAYIQSETETELKKNRTVLLNALQPMEQRYINEYYVPKERRFVAFYTRQLKNLGQSATQRVESYHRVLKSVTHGKLSLEASAKSLCAKVNDIYVHLNTAEDQAALNRFTALDLNIFRLLVGSVSLFAIKQTQGEWIQMRAKLQTNQELGECHCNILQQYSLPCRHYLRLLWNTGAPIPRSFLHPRWWLKGPVTQLGNWVPSSEQVLARPSSPRQQDVHSVLHDIMGARDQLMGDERARFDEQIFRTGRALQASARDKMALAKLPIQNPDAIEKKQWRKKKPIENSRAMTGSEIAAADSKRAERERKQAEKNTAILQARRANETRERVSETLQLIAILTCFQALAEAAAATPTESQVAAALAASLERSAARAAALMSIAPPPAPPFPPPPPPTTAAVANSPIGIPDTHPPPSPPPPPASTSPSPSLPPASTAPPILGRIKRQRTHTERYEEAVDALGRKKRRNNN